MRICLRRGNILKEKVYVMVEAFARRRIKKLRMYGQQLAVANGVLSQHGVNDIVAPGQ